MNQYHYNLKWRDRKSFLSLSVNSQSQDCQKSVSCNNEQHFPLKLLCLNNDFMTIDHRDSFQKSVKYMTWWQDLWPHHLSSMWRPLLSKLIIQDGLKTDDTLSRVCLAHFPDNDRAIWSNFVKMEGICNELLEFFGKFPVTKFAPIELQNS